MKNLFQKKAVLNAYGQTAENAVDRPFRRFVRILALSAMALVLIGGTALIWQRAHSLSSRLDAMESDVARLLADALDIRKDTLSILERGRGMIAIRRNSFRKVRVMSEEEAKRLTKMYNLEEKLLPRWCTLLGPQADEERAMPYEDRFRLVRTELLVEQENWPPPPAPPLSIALSDGIRKMSEGGLVGLSWPYETGKRIFMLNKCTGDEIKLSWGDSFRYAVFPFRLAAFSFPWILGFGLVAAGAGYFLCYLGMKTDYLFFTSLGLLYFLYIVVFVLFLFFLLFGVIQ